MALSSTMFPLNNARFRRTGTKTHIKKAFASDQHHGDSQAPRLINGFQFIRSTPPISAAHTVTHTQPSAISSIGFGSMAKLAGLLLLLLAVASSAAVLAHGRDLPTRIKLNRGASTVGGDSMECVYTVYIRTGSIWKAGTNSNITLELAGADGNGVGITDLPSWGGLMGQGHSYFERSNLDIFSGRGPCMAKPPCWMRVASDGTGPHHGWYCNYVEVTATGPHRGCTQQLFTVEQWLATDAAPYKLEAVRDNCSGWGAAAA